MKRRPLGPMARRGAIALVLPSLLAAAGAGCLGDPPVEERLTRLEILSASPVDAEAFAVGGTTRVDMRVRITYREILTGSLVGELRASESLTANDTALEAEESWEEKSENVDLILENSVSLGFDAIPATGWDHLVQEVDLTFDAGTVQMDASGLAPAIGAPTGLFIIFYFASEVEEVELENGDEIEVVVPLLSRDHPILYAGIEIVPVGAGGGS